MSGSRVSVPNSVRKMIQNIKEITGNDSDEEIYAMLKECSMDPNETAQKLLLQDTFHEVKRKRDRKKEIQNLNKESAESRWRPGMQGRGSRGGRGNYATRYTSHDAGGGWKSASGKENGVNQIQEKCIDPSMITSMETKEKDANSRRSKLDSPLPPSDANKTSATSFQARDGSSQPALIHSNSLVSITQASAPAVSFSSSNHVSLSNIQHEVGTEQALSEQLATAAGNKISASESSKSQGKNQITENSQASSTSTNGSSSISRPSSNYNNRSQQIIGPPKVGSNKEWKPKLTNPGVVLTSGAAGASDVPSILGEVSTHSQPGSDVVDSKEATSEMRRKLEELHLPPRQSVILPNHIHVPESERTKLSFGSFGASFGVTTGYTNDLENERSSTLPSETSQGIEEAEELALSKQNELTTVVEGDLSDNPQSPKHVPENLSSGDIDVPANPVPDYNEPNQDSTFLPGGYPYSVVHTTPNYSFGLVPPVVGLPGTAFENSDPQARDGSRLPNFIVQQPFDPASYYAQFYGGGADSDGRLSPFPSNGIPTKYNGSVTMLPSQSSHSPQEGGNSLVLSTAGPTALVTQSAGLMQSSITMNQQPVPVFRPPGLHFSHYPPNYIPYGPYFSHPFYVPSPAIHQILSNGLFPHQPQISNLYPAPPAGTTTGVKYSLPPYKHVTNNTGNTTHIGMPSGYGAYGSLAGSYNPNSTSAPGNTSNEDHGPSQFKESNVYNSGQQSEGVAVWIAGPGRDVSNLPASSFYNLPPQGQHVAYSPTQAGHGPFAGMHHHALTGTATGVHPLMQQPQAMGGPVEMAGPAASVYQQPQHAHVNWPSNY